MSCPMMPIGSIAVPSQECRSTMLLAGNAAEIHGDRRSRGLPANCVRGRYKTPITQDTCLSDYRAGKPECARDGGCSIGRVLDAKFKEDNMPIGPCRNPECPAHTMRVTLRQGLCLNCYDAQNKAKSSPKTADILDEPFKDIDASFPFVLAGIKFLPPLEHRRARQAPVVSVKKRGLSLRVGVVEQHGLNAYVCAKVCPSVDGTALAIKFYREAHDGAVNLRGNGARGGGMMLAAETVTTKLPGLIGQEAPLESTAVRDWFVVRFGGEAAA